MTFNSVKYYEKKLILLIRHNIEKDQHNLCYLNAIGHEA